VRAAFYIFEQGYPESSCGDAWGGFCRGRNSSGFCFLKEVPIMKTTRRKWTREQKEEARFRELCNIHRESLKVLVRKPEKLRVLKEIAGKGAK